MQTFTGFCWVKRSFDSSEQNTGRGACINTFFPLFPPPASPISTLHQVVSRQISFRCTGSYTATSNFGCVIYLKVGYVPGLLPGFNVSQHHEEMIVEKTEVSQQAEYQPKADNTCDFDRHLLALNTWGLIKRVLTVCHLNAF